MPDSVLPLGAAARRPPRRPSPVRAFIDTVPAVTSFDASTGETATRAVGGVVSAYKARATYEQDISQARLIRDVEDGRRELALLQAQLQAARAEATDKHLEVQALERERAAAVARMEAARDDASLPAAERLARVGRLKQALELSDRALAAEKRRIAEVDRTLARDEHAAVDLEVELMKKTERLEGARAAHDAAVQRARGAAEARAGQEVHAGASVARAMAAREGESRRHASDAAAAAEEAVRVMSDANLVARDRVSGSSGARDALVAAAKRSAQELLVSRANAVLSLKAHVEHASSETRADGAAHGGGAGRRVRVAA